MGRAAHSARRRRTVLRTRKRIEECFGWAKEVGSIRKAKFRGVARVDFQFVLTMAAYNLIRLRALLELAPT